MSNDPSKVTAAVNADPLINDLHDMLDLSEAFALFTVAEYNNKLEKTLWRMMDVDSTLQGQNELMKCSCGKYYHYLVCEHVIFWHMLHGQVTTPSTLKVVDHVNRAQKLGTSAPGYPMHMRKIPKGGALSSAY